MKIVLCCQGGFSTTMLMDSMKRTVRDSKKLDEADFTFKAIPADQLPAEVDDTDVVILGPQVAHREGSIREVLAPHNIPYAIVDKDTYAQMDGATVLKMALVARKKADLAAQGK